MGTKPPAAVGERIFKDGDTTWAPQRRPRPKRLSCKGDWEVQPSRRNWSRSSVHLEPIVQYSYPHVSLELQLRHPLCARESSCLLARLPPWRDAAGERPALGVLQAAQNVSLNHPGACPTFSPIVLNGSLSLYIYLPARVGQTRILLGGRGYSPRRQPRSPSVAC